MRLILAVAAIVLLLPATARSSTPAAGPTAAPTCAAALELVHLGRDSDAQAMYLQLVEAGDHCRGTTAALHPSWPRRVTQFVSAWWSFALYSALVVGFVFALTTRYRPIRGGLRRLPIVGASFQPRVSVAAFDSSATGTLSFGKAATALVNNALRRLAGDSLANVNHITVATGVESASATVAKLGDLGTQLKAAAAVMGFLGQVVSLPLYQLGGTLQPEGAEGVGLTLTLDRRSRAVDATTLWVKPKKDGDVDAYQTLSMLAAAWIDYAMRKDELPDEFEFTPSPKSYAYFRLGVLWLLMDEAQAAKEAFRDALTDDPSNVGAMLNLAELLRRNVRDDVNTADARKLLADAHTELHQLPEHRFAFIWYQVLYNQAALELNRNAAGGAAQRETQTAATTAFAEDSITMVRRLGYVGVRHRWRYPRLPERQHLGTRVRRYGVVRSLVRWHRPPARGFARFLFENAEPNAILFALWDIQPDGIPGPAHLGRLGRRALSKRLHEVRRYEEARAIVEHFVARRRSLSYRTKYNLGCYYASRNPQTAEGPRKACEWLREAFQDAPPLETVLLARRALFDPTLETLRQQPAFAALLSPFLGVAATKS